jgi:hypothetical protein
MLVDAQYITAFEKWLAREGFAIQETNHPRHLYAQRADVLIKATPVTGTMKFRLNKSALYFWERFIKDKFFVKTIYYNDMRGKDE